MKGAGLKMHGARFKGSGLGAAGCRVQGAGLRVLQDAGCRAGFKGQTFKLQKG